jgi:hypothetical protein
MYSLDLQGNVGAPNDIMERQTRIWQDHEGCRGRNEALRYAGSDTVYLRHRSGGRCRTMEVERDSRRLLDEQ